MSGLHEALVVMKLIKKLAVVVVALSPMAVVAAPIYTTWHIDDLFQYDYVTGSYEAPTVPTSFDLNIVFPSEVADFTDYGQTTITYFGSIGDTKFFSPLDPYIGDDPFGGGLDDQVAYTFPNVSDYDSTFYESFAAQSNVYSPSGDQFWAYHIELRARRYTPSLGGTGSEDYSFSTALLLEYLDDILANPTEYQFGFNQSFALFDGTSGTYLGGKSWSSYNEDVRLLSVSVPEPSTLALFGIGLAAMGLTRRRKKT